MRELNTMMFLWFAFMILFVAALVLPLAQEVNVVRMRGVLSGIVGVLLGGLVFSLLLAYIGLSNDGIRGGLVMGFAGATTSVLLVIVLGIMSAINDARMKLR
jgi:hypothetical protein